MVFHNESQEEWSVGVDRFAFPEQNVTSFRVGDKYPNAKGYIYEHDDVLFVLIKAENLWKNIDTEDYFIIKDCVAYQSSKEIYKIKVSNAVKEVTREEFVKTAGQILQLPKSEIQWDGIYVTNFSSLYKAEIAELPNNMFSVSISDGNETYEYTGYEVLNDERSSKLIYELVLLDDPYAKIQYIDEFDDLEQRYRRNLSDIFKSDYVIRINYVIFGGDYYPFSSWKAAPSAYKDELRDDCRAYNVDPEDSKFFVPTTDDYVVTARYENSYQGATGYTRSDKVRECYELSSFNKNGIRCSCISKYVYNSAAEAKMAYEDDFYFEPDSNPVIIDNVLYFTSANDAAEKSELVGDCYNCNYSFYHDYRDNNEEVIEGYKYISKPYTSAEMNLSIDDVLFWASKYGRYKIDDTDSSIWLEFNDKSLYFYASDLEIYKYLHAASISGRKAIFCTAVENGKDGYLLKFFELEFNEEVGKLTMYEFKIADLYDDSINFDNFKDQDPERITITEYTLTPEE